MPFSRSSASGMETINPRGSCPGLEPPSPPTTACEGEAGSPQCLGLGQMVGEADDDFRFWVLSKCLLSE